MNEAHELLRRALEHLEWCNEERYNEDLEDEIRTYLANQETAKDEYPSDGWHLREVYFEDGEPLMHREIAEPARKPMTSEEMEKQYEIDKEYFGESVIRAFYNGIRFAEKHHGITEE